MTMMQMVSQEIDSVSDLPGLLQEFQSNVAAVTDLATRETGKIPGGHDPQDVRYLPKSNWGKENATASAELKSSNGETCQNLETLPIAERRQRRKPLNPRKSPALCDPSFRGVTLCFQTVVRGSTSKLIITPIFSKNLRQLQSRIRQNLKSEKKMIKKVRNQIGKDKMMNCDQQHIQITSVQHPDTKSCASCATHRTPLWRDAEDGTPLCNACGIRYRKYRLRCSRCWHIPRKDNAVFPTCCICGSLLRIAQARKY